MNQVSAHIPLQTVRFGEWEKKDIQVSVLREDLVHPYISGNKGRKLKYNLIDFFDSGKKTMLTFGGAFSNHLIATAAAGREYGFECIGIVRGDEIKNPYLDFMQSCGMKLHFISREDYRNKTDSNTQIKILESLLLKSVIKNLDDVFIIPEGGANFSAVKGASEIMNEISDDMNYICCACGTGATVTGLSLGLKTGQQLIAIPVLKAPGFLKSAVESLGGNIDRMIIKEDYHFGGYAKKDEALMSFCDKFYNETEIRIEPVYTGKLFFAVNDMINSGYFKQGDKINLIHTGGIYTFCN
jgi:1-aminocyclopropane-1-carboxylate deaminase